MDTMLPRPAPLEHRPTAETSPAADPARRILLQRVLLARPSDVRPLYWRAEPPCAPVLPHPGGGLAIPQGAALAFDTYFNAFFERPWRTHAALGPLRLHVALEGQALLRVWRRSREAGRVLLHEALVDGPAEVDLDGGQVFREAGLLWFELSAQAGPVVLHGAQWSTLATNPAATSLAVVICTFNREGPLAAVLESIAGDTGLNHAVARVIVVNQGHPGLVRQPAIAEVARRLGGRLRIHDQPNLGGAGGFGRGMLEALDDEAATHVCLLDDDVRLEPESLHRMAAFFALARRDVALGGHMLDAVCPSFLYEAGATVRPDGTLLPLDHGLDLIDPGVLDHLLEPSAMHYNGWWMFGIPKTLLRSAGMPMPCFIRGDDVEYGLRLHQRGHATVSLPGVGLWHEPFYLKIGGWQLYYEVRNALMAAALHQDFAPRRIALQALRRLMAHLLTFRYYDAALIVRALEDAARGPVLLDGDPRPVNASLARLRARYPDRRTSRDRVLPDTRLARTPRGHAATALAYGAALLRNWFAPTRPEAPPGRVPGDEQHWFRYAHADCVVVDAYWEPALPTHHRDRAAFRSLLSQGLAAIRTLHRRAPALRREWRDALPRLASTGFWRAYLRSPGDSA